MLAVKGIIKMVMKQGSASVKSLRSILVTEPIIRTPTNTSALVVAAEGMMRKKGEKNKARRNNTATVSEVRPVRPPAAIPVVLST